MKKLYIRMVLLAALCLCLSAPLSFAMDKQELIKELNRQIDLFRRSIPECPVISKDPGRCVAQYNKMIKDNQEKIARLLSEESPGEKATRAKCGITPVGSDLCVGNLVCMTNFCGGEATCPYVCCPKGLPYLNHCDCKCYAVPGFDCHSSSRCQEQPKQ